ncbi:MAG: DNA (cytosine-5-)-methyltransferase, partial [Chloroflexota bacterium]
DEHTIPDHDILLAGFPCQPFSISGVSKKNSLGHSHGFLDETQGTLFFDIARILKAKQPPVFMLENVKNLKSHDGGRTFAVITNTLEELGYTVFTKVLDARYYVPQHRERIFIIGFHRDVFTDPDYHFPTPPAHEPPIASILEPDVDPKYTLSDKLWTYLQDYAEKHRRRGNGFGFGLVDPAKDITTRTLSARYYKDGSEILIKQRGKNPRRLIPRECARLMGFDDTFIIPVSDTQAYKQFGNSMVVPLVADIALSLQPHLLAITPPQLS